MDLISLVIEQVIAGLHALMWLGLLVFAFVGYPKIDWANVDSAILAIPVSVMAYILGIVIDKLADGLLNSPDHRIREKIIGDDPEHIGLSSWLPMRFRILSKSKDVYERLEYIRSRIRITRCAAVNFVFTMMATLVFWELQLKAVFAARYELPARLIILIVGLLLIWGVYRTWVSLTKSYYVSVLTAHKVLYADTSKATDQRMTPTKKRQQKKSE